MDKPVWDYLIGRKETYVNGYLIDLVENVGVLINVGFAVDWGRRKWWIQGVGYSVGVR